ncbi:MAG: PilZ domain-containing protein [Vicinamibacterales bacterium]
MSSSIVLIGPADALPALQARLAPGAGLRTFTSDEALEALDHVIQHQPRIVALEPTFAASSRGTALINRIKADPSLIDCEVRVLAQDPAAAAPASAAVAPAAAAPASALDQRGTRRAPRVPIAAGVDVQIDGNPAALVDLSAIGAQVLSTTVLRPNQRVRVVVADTAGQVRCAGVVAWASFEMPKGQPPRYRAGLEFTAADGAALDAFAVRHRRA